MGGRVLFALSIAAFPEDLPRDTLAAVFDGRGGEGARGRWHARRRPHDPRPRAEVRPGGHRRGAPRPAAAQGRRAARRPAAADEAARDRAARHRARARGGPRPSDLAAAVDQMRTLNRAASEVLVASGHRGGDRRDRLRPARPRARDGPRVRHAVRVRGRPPCRRSPARSSWPPPASRPAARPTTGASSPRADRRGRRRTGARDARPRSADVRRAAGGRSRPTASPRSRPRSTRRGVEHWWIGSVDADSTAAGTVALT